MTDEVECKPSVRSLYSWEVNEASRVFSENLKYEKIRIFECVSTTDVFEQLGQRLKGLKPHPSHNAITIGNNCIFPVKLLERPVTPDHPNFYLISWLIHELTHAWQYQHMGWRYLFEALRTQLTLKEKAYDFGHRDGLKSRKREGWSIKKFNMEQQGDICRSYYDRLSKGKDVSDWLPFIEEFRNTKFYDDEEWDDPNP